MSFEELPAQVVGPVLGWRIKPCFSSRWVGVANIGHMDADAG